MRNLQNIAISAILSIVAITSAQAETRVSIGTGGTGGVFYTVGAGMADVLTKKLTGVTANAEVTGASVENIKRVAAGEMTMGFSSASTLYAANTVRNYDRVGFKYFTASVIYALNSEYSKLRYCQY